MDAEPPLDYLLDGPTGPTPGRDELVAIVARSRARRYRVAALGMAGALIAGAVGGWLAGAGSGRPSGGATLAAGEPTTTIVGGYFGAAVPLVAPGAVAPGGPGQQLIRKFVRTTSDGVTIRAYEQPSPGGIISYGGCGTGPPITIPVLPSLDAELSTATVAGQTYSGYGSAVASPLTSVSFSMIGVAEGSPVWVVTVNTESSVAQVEAIFADGKTDQMAPVGGWAVLAHQVPAGRAASATDNGTVEAKNAAGQVIARASFMVPPPITGTPTTWVPPQVGVPLTTVPGTGIGAPIPVNVPGQPAEPPSTAVGSPPTTNPVPPQPCVTTIPPDASGGPIPATGK